MSRISEKSSNSGSTREPIKRERWYWLDWLRVLAMGTIFLYHCGRPFIHIEWHIMNPEPDMLFTIVNIFVSGWIMPLFFVISGMATYFSLAKRNPTQFTTSRFKRLMIPFIFGLFIILPVHRYYGALFGGYFTESFKNFYFWRYFLKDFPLDSNLSLTYFAGSNQGVYLWYIFWLFVFSLITVHLFKWLRKEENRNKISKLATACNRRGGIFVLGIPLIIVDLAAIPPYFVFPSDYGGWKLPTYLAFFILAYVLASDSQFEHSIDKNKILALILGISMSILIIMLFGLVGIEGITSERLYLLVSFIWTFNGWCWVITILGFGRRFLHFNNRFLQTSNELVLPFYILHETVIVAIAFYIVGLNVLVMGKYLIIIFVSFAIISLLLVPISKINILRFLFGMRVKRKT
ncbi:MAG: acyltransferase family protein [Candidatus Hodarchaeota archaeon]